ncbi:hypothetical protein PHYBLDRAFT_151250 [Phycomyces blakesleeanus NRRL 1555(-)]|uniref:DDE-1 domain-containing protein n=1 Tax=Phycomyces blakesleeanus (strain ATCC 8743b / DSM 1359 / FGSC 10004 / NBRC 33097 / NRRL 1555) TaxID=763407 RepID=A0A162TDH0_PHYB8|nr:hypothetical protein PHYBLDRAFT_151250 [Phycomyces blakesleeanus NRRL 1555(-)]OAD67722.1 hypothetical protein PHYBLDRAFT_151250 [Phycomyces blakesleeanus NRRL 1555(-)]|eukprot:XP_018285762.1 hypothetical protein PHYBLDRAFT_151250 [Phycomyces blakesleeanus NRRL 1555(-)]
MKAQKYKMLLILDNFSGHIVDYVPTNVELLFLSPNTTSHLQPLDGEILQAFKAYFKHKQYAKAYQYIGMIQNGQQDNTMRKKEVHLGVHWGAAQGAAQEGEVDVVIQTLGCWIYHI